MTFFHEVTQGKIFANPGPQRLKSTLIGAFKRGSVGTFTLSGTGNT